MCPSNKHSPHFKQQASNKQPVKADYNNQTYKKSRTIHVPKTDGRSQQRSTESGAKRKKNDFTDMKDEPEQMLSGWNPNKNGNRASPAVRHTMKKLEKLPSAERKRILPELQRAMVIENIAANFVSSGNRKDMIQELRKLSDTSWTRTFSASEEGQDYIPSPEGWTNNKCNDGHNFQAEQGTTCKEATIL